MDSFRYAGRFAAEQEDVAALEGMSQIRCRGARGEEDEPQALAAPPAFERFPGRMPRELHLIEIVHAGAAKRAIARRKARWFDQMRLDAEAGGESENRSGVLRDVGLEEGNAHAGAFRSVVGRHAAQNAA